MIYSSIYDNWLRVTIMHTVSRDYFIQTKDSDYRKRNAGDSLFFDSAVFTFMEKESCIVQSVMVWSVITLESLINHVLAEVISDKDSVIKAIEYPKNFIKVHKIDSKYISELASKILIFKSLSEKDEDLDSVLILADELSKIRNSFVHDKPFDLHVDEIKYFKSRGDNFKPNCAYEDLEEFYEKCDKIKNYILKDPSVDIDNYAVDTKAIQFLSLYTD